MPTKESHPPEEESRENAAFGPAMTPELASIPLVQAKRVSVARQWEQRLEPMELLNSPSITAMLTWSRLALRRLETRDAGTCYKLGFSYELLLTNLGSIPEQPLYWFDFYQGMNLVDWSRSFDASIPPGETILVNGVVELEFFDEDCALDAANRIDRLRIRGFRL
jgi:hypothetical protein